MTGLADGNTSKRRCAQCGKEGTRGFLWITHECPRCGSDEWEGLPESNPSKWSLALRLRVAESDVARLAYELGTAQAERDHLQREVEVLTRALEAVEERVRQAICEKGELRA
jgi:predicted  nucleic acid-binding Zn-ribbon protein